MEYLNEQNMQSESGNVTFIRKKLVESTTDVNHYKLEFGVYTQLSNINLCIVNIHLDDLSSKTRYNQLLSVQELLYRTKKCIMGGDFNQPYRKNTKIYNLPNFTTHNLNCPTYYIEKKMNIDNILTRGFRCKYNEDDCVEYPGSMEEGFQMYGSDHLPVITYV